ncbi:MAG: hypothetical protein ACTSRG_21635 [Candidatus Helarchaeota archaeon]
MNSANDFKTDKTFSIRNKRRKGKGTKKRDGSVENIINFIYNESFRNKNVRVSDVVEYIGKGKTQTYEIINRLSKSGMIKWNKKESEVYFDPEFFGYLSKFTKEGLIPFSKRNSKNIPLTEFIETKMQMENFQTKMKIENIETIGFDQVEEIISNKFKQIFRTSRIHKLKERELLQKIRDTSILDLNTRIKSRKIRANNNTTIINEDIFIGDSLIYENLISTSQEQYKNHGRYFSNIGTIKIGTYKLYNSDFFATIIPIIVVPVCYEFDTPFFYPQFRFFNPRNLPFRELFSEFPDLQDNFAIHYTLEILKDASMYSNLSNMIDRFPSVELIQINGPILTSYPILGKKIKNQSYRKLYKEYTDAFKGFFERIVRKNITVVGSYISNNSRFIYECLKKGLKDIYNLESDTMTSLALFEKILNKGYCSCLFKRPDKKFPFSLNSNYFKEHFFDFYLSNWAGIGANQYELFIPKIKNNEEVLKYYKELVNFLFWNSTPRLDHRGAIVKSYKMGEKFVYDHIIIDKDKMSNDGNFTKYFFSPKTIVNAMYYGIKYMRKLELFLHRLLKEKAWELFEELEEEFFEDILKEERGENNNERN